MWSDILIQFVFGFAAGILSLLVSALGIWKKWWFAMVLAGLWTIPATVYLSAASGLPLFLLCLFQFGGAYAVYKGKPYIAWYLLIPLLLVTIYMTYLTSFSLFESPR
jgi:hypothetical protein